MDPERLVIRRAELPGMYSLDLKDVGPESPMNASDYGLHSIACIEGGYRLTGSWSALRTAVEASLSVKMAETFYVDRPYNSAPYEGLMQEVARRSQLALETSGWVNVLTDQKNDKMVRWIMQGRVPGIDPSSFIATSVRYPARNGRGHTYDIELRRRDVKPAERRPLEERLRNNFTQMSWSDRIMYVVLMVAAIVTITVIVFLLQSSV